MIHYFARNVHRIAPLFRPGGRKFFLLPRQADRYSHYTTKNDGRTRPTAVFCTYQKVALIPFASAVKPPGYVAVTSTRIAKHELAPFPFPEKFFAFEEI